MKRSEGTYLQKIVSPGRTLFQETQKYNGTSLLKVPELSQTHMTLLGDDDMVEHPDAEDRPGLHELSGDADILGGGVQGSRGVVVDQDDRRSAIGDRLAKTSLGWTRLWFRIPTVTTRHSITSQHR